MKQIKIFALCMLCLLLGVTSCKKDDDKKPSPNPDEDKPPVTETSVEEVETWLKGEVETVVIDQKEINLPTKYQDKNVTISWESDHKTYINSEGTIIKRNTKKITDVKLTYTITNEVGKTLTGFVTVKLYPRTFDYVSNTFRTQFPERLAEDMRGYIFTDICDGFTITWKSSNESIFTNEGEYIRPLVDTPIVISYTVEANGVTKEFDFEMVVLGASDIEKVAIVTEWLKLDIIPDLYVTKDLKLPSTHPDHGTRIEWFTSDDTIIDLKGHVTRYVLDRYVELHADIYAGDQISTCTFWITVPALDTTNMTEKQIVENFLSAIARKELSRLMFTGYAGITQTFNGLYFFDNKWAPHVENIAPKSNVNRPGTKQPSTSLVVVHDTANNSQSAGAEMHNRFVYNGGGEHEVSFHYVVGNDGIYHNIPNDEVCYHAGDGTRYNFKLYDTGVAATVKRPNITIKDRYFYFNGKKSKLMIPEDAPSTASITESGLIYEVKNGNYWLNENYFNSTYHSIVSRGGNTTGIGIETCVNKGSDYLKTCFLNASLVAKLLTYYNLDVLRTVQHNNMSGKPCPKAIMVANYWQNFRDLVSIEKFGMATFEGLTFEWNSGSDILNNEGFIKKDIKGAKDVKYSVVVKRGADVVFEQQYTTVLIDK